jgi:hypothetical protein
MDLTEYYTEVVKTAGLLPEDISEEKIAACNAVYEQFDIDGIDFDSEEEKQAAAFAIVDGFEKVAMDADQRASMNASIARDRAKEIKSNTDHGFNERFKKLKSGEAQNNRFVKDVNDYKASPPIANDRASKIKSNTDRGFNQRFNKWKSGNTSPKPSFFSSLKNKASGLFSHPGFAEKANFSSLPKFKFK